MHDGTTATRGSDIAALRELQASARRYRGLLEIEARLEPCRRGTTTDELQHTRQPASLTVTFTAPPTMTSNIRVFVQWKNSTVFAGEDIECTITFKNTALPEGRDKSPLRKGNGFAPGGERQRRLPPVHSSTRPSVSRNSSFTSLGPSQQLRGHRPALSVQTASSIGDRNRSPLPPSGAFTNGSATPKLKQGHGKSISIISLGTDVATEASNDRSAASAARRPARGHGRSASLQVVPGRPSPFPCTNALIGRGSC